MGPKINLSLTKKIVFLKVVFMRHARCNLLGSYLAGSCLASSAKLASLTQMSAKVHMRSTKEIKLSAASIN